jgi:hypothetical protein
VFGKIAGTIQSAAPVGNGWLAINRASINDTACLTQIAFLAKDNFKALWNLATAS